MARHRRRGRIERRGQGKYLVRIFLGRDERTGKRRYSSKTIRGSRQEAEEKLTEMLAELDTGAWVDPSAATVGSYLTEWLTGKGGEIEPSTLRGYRDRLSHVIEAVGAMKLQDLKPAAVQGLYAQLAEKGLSTRTVRHTHMILRQALGQAMAWGMLRQNSCDLVKPPKLKPTQKVRPLTKPEARKLLESDPGRSAPALKALWTLLLTTGARPGEALALHWSDIDIERGCRPDHQAWIQINASMARSKDGIWERKEAPKNSSSRRQVSIPKSTARVLRDHRQRQLEQHMAWGVRTDYVFATRRGKPMRLSYVRRAWKEACARAGIPVVRLYDARHTHATHLLQDGINLKIVSERLGHSSVQMTGDVYSHVIPEMRSETAEIVERALFTKEEPTHG